MHHVDVRDSSDRKQDSETRWRLPHEEGRAGSRAPAGSRLLETLQARTRQLLLECLLEGIAPIAREPLGGVGPQQGVKAHCSHAPGPYRRRLAAGVHLQARTAEDPW